MLVRKDFGLTAPWTVRCECGWRDHRLTYPAVANCARFHYQVATAIDRIASALRPWRLDGQR